MKTNTFYKLDYIPNKLVFVYSIYKKEIRFLAFMKEKNNDFKAIKHSINLTSKKDFNNVDKSFNPIPKIKELINENLTFQL